MKPERVVLFESTRFAIRAERMLKEAGVRIAVVPTPRKYSSNCGVSIAFEKVTEEEVVRVLKEKGVPFSGPFDY